MQQIPTDILGLPKMEVRPRIVKSELSRPVEGRYVAISEFSTFEGKLWSYVGGWDEIVKYLHSLGYKVVSISKEPTRLKNVIAMNDRPIEESIRNLQYADFFIGVASGAMWLAWGLGLPVVVISGFTMPYSEMKEDCYRVINDQVCTGCYNDTTTTFDRNNWRWCPRGKNYECSTSITPDSVKVVIDRLMQDKGFEKSAEITSLDELRPKRVLFLSPHCSTGGLPQYMYQLISSLKEGGHDIEVIEYTNLSDTWVVQKNKIKQLCTIHTLNGDKPAQIEQIISEFDPDVIHLQEFPENWLDEKSCSYLYREKHPYKIIETSHGSEFDPQNKQYRPDGFCFVGKFHAKQYQKFGVPTKIIEYQTIPHSRPDRTEALINIGLDPSKKHILNVGLFAPHKNQGEIFAIARKLPDCLFHFIGNQADNFRPYWEPLLADKPKNCIIWGEQEDVDSFYGAMDLFLFTSIKETNPLVVKEALSWQMPVMMKKLPTYMGDYNNQPKVIFINNNIDKTISLIRKIFPSVLDDIENIYGFKA
jgi:glycosyltransferase involved in cell wall biosynthesis